MKRQFFKNFIKKTNKFLETLFKDGGTISIPTTYPAHCKQVLDESSSLEASVISVA